jgi:hypothetical protein
VPLAAVAAMDLPASQCVCVMCSSMCTWGSIASPGARRVLYLVLVRVNEAMQVLPKQLVAVLLAPAAAAISKAPVSLDISELQPVPVWQLVVVMMGGHAGGSWEQVRGVGVG